jgi:hypothetical protein
MGAEKVKGGVELTSRPPQRTMHGTERALKIDLPEHFLLPYESAQEID